MNEKNKTIVINEVKSILIWFELVRKYLKHENRVTFTVSIRSAIKTFTIVTKKINYECIIFYYIVTIFINKIKCNFMTVQMALSSAKLFQNGYYQEYVHFIYIGRKMP